MVSCHRLSGPFTQQPDPGTQLHGPDPSLPRRTEQSMGFGRVTWSPFCSRPPRSSAVMGHSCWSHHLRSKGPQGQSWGFASGCPPLLPCPTLPAGPNGRLHPRGPLWLVGKDTAQSRELLFVPSAVTASALGRSRGDGPSTGLCQELNQTSALQSQAGTTRHPFLPLGPAQDNEALSQNHFAVISDQGQILLCCRHQGKGISSTETPSRYTRDETYGG